MALDILKPMKQETVLNYDYDGLEESIKQDLISAVMNIRPRLSRAAEDVIWIGRELIEVKDLLSHGEWGKWIASEFGMSDQSARRFMHVGEKFGHLLGSESNKLLNLGVSVLYELAAPSTPEVVIEQATKKVIEGEPVSVSDVRQMKQEAKRWEPAKDKPQVTYFEQHMVKSTPLPSVRGLLTTIDDVIAALDEEFDNRYYELTQRNDISEAVRVLLRAKQVLEEL